MIKDKSKQGIIGGMFGLDEMTPNLVCTLPPFLTGRDIFLANGRSGFWLLLKKLAPHQVWVPSYLCGGILTAVDQTGTQIRFYEVSYDLALSSFKWMDHILPGDLVVLIDYFGFLFDSSCAMRAKEKGAWVLEDAAQALLSENVGQFSDFVIYSPRKFLGVPDGGILTLNSNLDLSDVLLSPSPSDWWLKAFNASVLRREFDIHSGDRRWFDLFQQSESAGPIGSYAMSELAQMLLKQGFNYPDISQRRINNYNVLAQELSEISLFPALPKNVVPLGFPIRLENRDKLREVLFKHQIYPPIHWPIQGVVPEKFGESHRLVEEIMTLPCDQRYGPEDMQWLAEIILTEVK